MGVVGLLPRVRPYLAPGHLSDMQGSTVGVDVAMILVRAALACSVDIVAGKGVDKRFDDVIRSWLKLFGRCGVRPIFVFDGNPFPMKARVHQERQDKAAEAMKKAKALYEKYSAGSSTCPRVAKRDEIGSQLISAANAAISVTSEMRKRARELLVTLGEATIVAPYEADAQLVSLQREGLIKAIVTEDSDLIVFGAETIVYNLSLNGTCSVFRAEDVRKNSPFDKVSFLDLALLLRSDYLPNVPGVGFAKAVDILSSSKSKEEIQSRLNVFIRRHVGSYLGTK